MDMRNTIDDMRSCCMCYKLKILLFISFIWDALLKLKASMNGHQAKDYALQYWKFSTSPSFLSSATFRRRSETWTPIALNNLTGELPKELASLTSLKHLNISHSFFNGTFPGEVILPMMELEVLDVYDNNFTGPLPEEFAKLEKLTYLKLDGNYFSGGVPEGEFFGV